MARSSEVRERWVDANGLRFHCVEAGDVNGQLVLLLHGFPEFWRSWKHQIPVLAEDFHVVAVDLRGYNLTDKPATGYSIDDLTDDIRALIAALGVEQAHLVGHDWGGVLAFAFAYRYPRLLSKLAVLNAPHPIRFAEELRNNPAQRLKSWYVAFFQLPWLPELLLSANDYAAVERIFRHDSIRPGTFSDEDILAYKGALAVPGALTCVLAYYRNALKLDDFAARWSEEKISSPTQILWGIRDVALELTLTDQLERFFAGPLSIERIPNSGHWVQLEAPEAVNACLVPFLRGRSP